MKYGHIKLSRRLFDGGDRYWSEPRAFSAFEAWVDLLQLAAYRPTQQRGVRLGRGELLISARYLAQRWGWSKSAVARHLNELERVQRVRAGQQVGHTGTVYVIVNYCAYQGGSQRSGTDVGTRDEGADNLRDAARETVRETTGAHERPASQRVTSIASPPVGTLEGTQSGTTSGTDVGQWRDKKKCKQSSSEAVTTTWLTAFANAHEAMHGPGSFSAICGQAAKHLAPLYHAGATPEQIGAHYARYLEKLKSDGSSKYLSIPRFASTFGQYAPFTGTLIHEGWMSEEAERLTSPTP